MVAQSTFPQLVCYFKELNPDDYELFYLFIDEIETLKSIEENSFCIDFLGYDDALPNYNIGEYRTLSFEKSDMYGHYSGDDVYLGEEETYATINLVKSQKTNRKNLEVLYYDANNQLPKKELKKPCADFVNAIFKYIEIGNKMLDLLKAKKYLWIGIVRLKKKLITFTIAFNQNTIILM